MQANAEIRRAMGGAGVKQWQLAEFLGFNESYFSRKLRKELPIEEKAIVLVAIEKLSKEKNA